MGVAHSFVHSVLGTVSLTLVFVFFGLFTYLRLAPAEAGSLGEFITVPLCLLTERDRKIEGEQEREGEHDKGEDKGRDGREGEKSIKNTMNPASQTEGNHIRNPQSHRLHQAIIH